MKAIDIFEHQNHQDDPDQEGHKKFGCFSLGFFLPFDRPCLYGKARADKRSSSQTLSECEPFAGEQLALQIESGRKASDLMIGGDYPMARKQHWNRVCAAGCPDGPRRFGQPDGAGDLTITPGPTQANLSQCPPYALLKKCSAGEI